MPTVPWRKKKLTANEDSIVAHVQLKSFRIMLAPRVYDSRYGEYKESTFFALSLGVISQFKCYILHNGYGYTNVLMWI